MKWGRPLEYVMPKAMYEALREEAPGNVNVKDWIINYINETYGLWGNVVELRVE